MKNATKVLLETIQVTKHMSQLGLRPLEKVATQAAQATEELAFWALKVKPVEDLLGRQQTKQILDSYMKVKEVAGESIASMSHQSWKSALQSGAQVATNGLQQAGVEARVVGPFDEHWNTVKVLKDLRTAASAQAAQNSDHGLNFTPKLFVQFMRDSERRKRRELRRDPIEHYVENLIKNGSLRSMGSAALEKQLYMEMARVICYSFDRSLLNLNGMDVWGHELHVKVVKEEEENFATEHSRFHTVVGIEQVETVVDWMLKSPDLEAPVIMEGWQRQLLINCSVMILELIQDLISDRHMQLGILGHSLRIVLEPWPLKELLAEAAKKSDTITHTFPVNDQAVNELVDALIEEPEVQLIFVPDLLESEIYRYLLHRMICIGQFILSQLRIRLFGLEINLSIVSEEGWSSVPSDDTSSALLQVPAKELQSLFDQLEHERVRVEQILRSRQERTESPEGQWTVPEEDYDMLHEFQEMAAQDTLSRSLSLQRNLSIPIDLAYKIISDFKEYPEWLPFCESATILSEGKNTSNCELKYGWQTGTPLDAVMADRIKYRLMLSPPAPKKGSFFHEDICHSARVVIDTVDDFVYGKRLVYDWRFNEVMPGETEVRLDMFFQAKNVLVLPLWDGFHSTLIKMTITKFSERASKLSDGKDIAKSIAGSGTAANSHAEAVPLSTTVTTSSHSA